MDNALTVHRLHFAFTATFHYLFPQLTMGLAPLIVICKLLSLRRPDPVLDDAARFLARLFGITFAFGVVTGIPMEFQFGTNWARFSRFAGGVIGQTLAMEGMFAFFLESAFLGLFLFGEKRLSRRGHFLVALAVFLGSWLSGYFIVATDAWMQHPVGYRRTAAGAVELTGFWALLFNPWAVWQYLHTMGGAAVTGAFACAGLGAYYRLHDRSHERHQEVSAVLIRVGVAAALVSCVWQIFPSGDNQGKMIAHHQPATLAAMEGLFHTPSAGAPMVLVGQPNPDEQRIDNVLEVPGVLSFLTYKRWNAEIKGLSNFAAELRPDNVALLYYSYHIMVGLGTLLLALASLAALAWWRGRLLTSRPLLWGLLLASPMPFIANTAGWTTAELGRQPWLVYGLMRTAGGTSHRVSAGNGLFSLVGFMGIYSALAIVFVVLAARVITQGPGAEEPASGPRPIGDGVLAGQQPAQGPALVNLQREEH